MKTELENIQIGYLEFIKECNDTCYITRDSKFLKLLSKLHSTINETQKLKQLAVKHDDEGRANMLLAVEYYFYAIENKVKMLISLKDGIPNEAWNFLVSARENIEMSNAAYKLLLMDQEAFLLHLIDMERVFFHHKRFKVRHS
jgi:hypothetical protein